MNSAEPERGAMTQSNGERNRTSRVGEARLLTALKTGDKKAKHVKWEKGEFAKSSKEIDIEVEVEEQENE